VWVAGTTSQDFYPATQCQNATCSAYELEPKKPRVMAFFHADKLTGSITLKGDEKQPVVVRLSKPGAVKGRLLDADGKPLAGVVVDLYYRQRAVSEVNRVIHHSRQIITDAGGAFTVEDLVPQQKLGLFFKRGKQKLEPQTKAELEVKSGECRDLGTLTMKYAPEEGS
jgi:hypothetical protein